MSHPIEWMLDRPHAILALTLSTVLAGVMAYDTLPMTLFPDTSRPTVSVVSEWPGAVAADVAREVTHPIEVRLSAIDGVRRVTSTSRDQVSAVRVEFEYGNDIDMAATKVANELPRVRQTLPRGIRDPLILKITDAARPLVVLSVTSADGVDLDLAKVRRLAENPLRDVLLSIPGVAEAEIFGGAVLQVSVDLDRDKLDSYGLTLDDVAAALDGSNLSLPIGLLHREGSRFLLTAQALAGSPSDLGRILVGTPNGDHVQVADLGEVKWGKADVMSLYRGNGHASVAVSLLRSEDGHSREVIEEIEKALAQVRTLFPMLHIEIADTQGRLIDLTVDNMLQALRDALIMTLAVILLFLGNTRAAFITALSLPFTYLLTFAAMKWLGYEFNMVTLTAVIIAVGLLADDAIVVIENIERRMREDGEHGRAAAAAGTREILLADASGTISTVIVLVPIMFIGGFVETVLRPLTVTLSIALLASLLVSVTIIPLLVPRILRPDYFDPLGRLLSPFERFLLRPLKRFYAGIVGWGLQHRLVVLVIFAALFAASAPQLALLGRELMPLMDTGILTISLEAAPDTDDHEMALLAMRVEEAVRSEIEPGWLLSISTVIGAEPGVKSFGAARVLQRGTTTVNLVDRFKRRRSVYDIENGLRTRLAKIPGLISANASEFGATPVSSLRGTVDVMITGPDLVILDRLADQVVERLRTVRGLTGVERSWQGRSNRFRLKVDSRKARLYGLTARDVAGQVGAAINGVSGGKLRIAGENPIPVWVRLRPGQRSWESDLYSLPVRSRRGNSVPVRSLATIERVQAPVAETHEALLPTVDVLGFRRNIAVTHLNDNVRSALKNLKLPRGYRLSYEGEIKQMNESFERLGLSLGLGLALLYLMLAVTFRSFLDPLAIMATLPLAVIGAAWAMMAADKHGCLPSFMGLILLMGIVVNNGILLVDFTKVALAQGKSLREALLQAVELRTRPILMTASASAVGMIPIALEWAVGIERLSPLAVVAIGGLAAGTFLTLLAVPVLFHLIESLRRKFRPLPSIP